MAYKALQFMRVVEVLIQSAVAMTPKGKMSVRNPDINLKPLAKTTANPTHLT